jgi:hypothetical protein
MAFYLHAIDLCCHNATATILKLLFVFEYAALYLDVHEFRKLSCRVKIRINRVKKLFPNGKNVLRILAVIFHPPA